MVYKFRPMDVSIDFEKRTYRLGETVDVEIVLDPQSDLEVRAGNVTLECIQKFVHNPGLPTGVSTGRYGSFASVGVGGEGDAREETLVYSSTDFLGASKLRANRPEVHKVRLKIKDTVPPRAADAKKLHRDATRSWTFQWELVVKVDVRGGRNPETRREIKVYFPV